MYEPDLLDEMLNTATAEFCSKHVKIRWIGDQMAPDFSTWSVGQLKEYLTTKGIDFTTLREKSELRDACRGTLPYANNGEIARCGDGSTAAYAGLAGSIREIN